MMMVILQHIAYYGGWPFSLTDTFNPGFEYWFIQFIYHFGKICVWIFVLISGYYLVTSKSAVVPKFLKLLIQILAISILFDFIYVVFFDVPVESIDWLSVFFPFTYGNWWFATTYLIFLLFTPFVNRMLNGLTRREHLTLVIIMMAFWCIIPTFIHSSMYGSNVLMFGTMYTLGAYIRLHPEGFGKSARHYGLCTVGLIVLLGILIELTNIIGPTHFRPFEMPTSLADQRSVMVVLISTFTFLTFRQIKIGHSRLINTVASTTFGVYLIHEHDALKAWLFDALDMGSHFESPDLVPYVLLVMVGIFVCCSVIEYVRMRVLDPLADRAIPVISRFIYRIQSRLVGD